MGGRIVYFEDCLRGAKPETCLGYGTVRLGIAGNGPSWCWCDTRNI
jgi:hypothetical protein